MDEDKGRCEIRPTEECSECFKAYSSVACIEGHWRQCGYLSFLSIVQAKLAEPGAGAVRVWAPNRGAEGKAVMT